MWQRLRARLHPGRFTQRFSDRPRLTKFLNVAIPVSMVGGVLIGGVVLAFQIASWAAEGEVRLTLPENSSTKADDFHIRAVLTASQDRQPFNIIFKLDGRVVKAKVGAAISQGQVRDWDFDSGVGGAQTFNRNLLRPGVHTARIEARTGSTVGAGVDIDADEVKFTVSNVKNLVALGESTPTYRSDQLPLDANARPRNAFQPIQRIGAIDRLSDILIPKAQAHTGVGMRHGDINIKAPPGITVSVAHTGQILDGCHDGNSGTTDAEGIARFRTCSVTNNGGTSATYTITLGATPPGWSLNDVRAKEMTVTWNTLTSMAFNYEASAAAAAPVAAPPPAAGPDYAPDDGPLIALTTLSATSATVDVFGYQMKNNGPANFITEVSADVDGVRAATRTDLSLHATQQGLALALPNLHDGQGHNLRLRAVNANGKSNYIDVIIAAPDGATTTTTAPATSSDSPPASTPPAAVPPVPAGVKDGGSGRIQVTTYVYKNGKKERIGNAGIVVQAVSHPLNHVVNNKLLNCNPFSKTTSNRDKGSSGYGQAHFDNCWTSSDNTQSYVLNQINPPVGYSFRSIHVGEAGQSFPPDKQFSVKSNQETAIEVWLNPPGVTRTDNDNEDNLLSTATPPPTPTNLKATSTENGSPAVNLSWSESVGANSYQIDRSLDNINWETISGDGETTGVSYVDGDVDLIATHYFYRVAAVKDDGDSDELLSGYATTEITTPDFLIDDVDLKEVGPASIKLTWKASRANKDITYTVERSKDQKTWDELEKGIEDFDYTALEGEFATKYFFRVTAQKEDAVSSKPAEKNITTKAFESNIKGPDEDSSSDTSDTESPEDTEVSSDDLDKLEDNTSDGTEISDEGDEDDSAMEAMIPDGALGTEARCGIVKVDQIEDDEIPEDATLTEGPYALICKTKTGKIIERFLQAVLLRFPVDESEEDQEIYSVTSKQRIKSKNKSKKVLGASTRSGVFVLLKNSSPQGKSPLMIIGVTTGIVAGAAVGYVVIRRRMNANTWTGVPPDPDI